MVFNDRIPMLPFCTETSNMFPNLQASNNALQQRSPEILKNLRDILIINNQNGNFGFSLLHQHFPLKQYQILVELNNVTTPWTVSNADIADLHNHGFITYKTGVIVPTSWAFTNVSDSSILLMPYEYTYVEGGSASDAILLQDRKYTEFVDATTTALKQSELQGHIALTLLPDTEIDGAVETTIGEANIVRLRGEHNVASPFHASDCKHSHEIQASFFWPTEEGGKIPMKAKGSKCDSMDTCKCTVEDLDDSLRIEGTCPGG